MKIYFVDSFTDQPFKGNPAAVVIQDKLLSDKFMLNLAKEIGFSETAFLFQEEDASYRLRWFTPTTEVTLCGHATLATAKIFFTYLEPDSNIITFKTKYGEITCCSGDDIIQMDFPQDRLRPLKIYDEVKDYFAFTINKHIFYSERNHYLCIFVANELNLSSLFIDTISIININSFLPDIRGLIISNQADEKVQMRFFDPWEGIPEDPVTGSAALVVSEYWFKVFNKNVIDIEQKSLRGGNMQVAKEQDYLSISGRSTIVLEGNIKVGDYGQ